MPEDNKIEYANQWRLSAQFFYKNDDYTWMCDQIKQYKTVLEIGCGTGHSTLSLLENGHKIIAIEKNHHCLEKAKECISNSDYTYTTNIDDLSNHDVLFILSDICDNTTSVVFGSLCFDVVVCWNVGSFWDKEMIEYYLQPLLSYGLTPEQIMENPESSYVELIQWQSCKIANQHNVPIHFIDRGMQVVSQKNDPYYVSLKDEFEYKRILYNHKATCSLSSAGRALSVAQTLCDEEKMSIILMSILLS